VEEKPHDRFERKGDDLLYNAKIDLLTALAGGQFTITHLDGRVLLVNILPGETIKNGKLQTYCGIFHEFLDRKCSMVTIVQVK
jgi:DnaJ-class molecular chaperone